MDTFYKFWHEFYLIGLDSGPWLLLGLIVSGMIKVWLPEGLMDRFLRGKGLKPVVSAAVIGTPLPLCSCSVVPAAMAIRERGASKGATVSFLISTPENGADSLVLSYALLGPFMTAARPIAAIVSAVVAGVMTMIWGGDDEEGEAVVTKDCCSGGSCKSEDKVVAVKEEVASCCGSDNGERNDCCESEFDQSKGDGFFKDLKGVFTYGLVELVDDIAFWMTVGLVLAAVMNTFLSEDEIAGWGSGIGPMCLMILIGVPMYVCATESTPIGGSMLMAGVSPGTVLVFLLAGPATNLGTVGIIKKAMGWRTVSCYLAGIVICSLGFGLGVDWFVGVMGIDVKGQTEAMGEVVPYWLSLPSMILMGTLMLRSLFIGLAKRLRGVA